jgi:hypothetical protein
LLSKELTTLQHPTYTPDLAAAADLYMLPQLKSALKGRRLCDKTDIIKNATEELKRLSQNGFHECYQRLYSRWQRCLFAQKEDYEANLA